MIDQVPPAIVVVDDDEDTVTFLCDFLALLGFTPKICAPGPNVVACISGYQPSAFILDVCLEGMTGVDLLHQVRADPGMQTIPVIFFSGSEAKLCQLLPDYRAYGATFVPKPNVERLSMALQQLVQQPT